MAVFLRTNEFIRGSIIIAIAIRYLKSTSLIELAPCACLRGAAGCWGSDGGCNRTVPIDCQSTRNAAMSKRATARAVIPPQISAFSS